MERAADLARIFKVLSVEARIQIVELLRQRRLCVGALAAQLKISQSAVSQHLRILRDAGLVIPEKQGYWVHYRLNEDTLARWQELSQTLLSHE